MNQKWIQVMGTSARWHLLLSKVNERWIQIVLFFLLTTFLSVSAQSRQQPIRQDGLVCEKAQVQQCLSTADGYQRMGEDEKAFKLYEQACSFRAVEGCLSAGLLLKTLDQKRRQARRSNPRSRRRQILRGYRKSKGAKGTPGYFFNQACQLKSVKGCLLAGEIAERRGKLQRALNSYRSACQLRSETACSLEATVKRRIEEKRSSKAIIERRRKHFRDKRRGRSSQRN